MITLKKYTNGRFYDTDNKQYVTKNKLAQMIAKKEKVRIVLAKTGKDVTKSVVASLQPPKTNVKKVRKTSSPKKKTIQKRVEGHRKWIARQVEKRVDAVLEMMNFPNRQQIVKLNTDVGKLSDKVDDLHKRHAQFYAKLEQAHRKEMNDLTREYDKAIKKAHRSAPAAPTA